MAGLVLLSSTGVFTATAAGGPRPRAFGAAHRLAPESGPGAIYLPIAIKGRWTGIVEGAATARAAEATSRAATAAAETATARTPPPTGSPPPPTASATSPPASATATATRDTPTATTLPPAVTPTDGWPATPGPTPGLPDYASASVEPQGALAQVTPLATYDARRRTYLLGARGDISITYAIDMTHPDNAHGRLAVFETESNRFGMAGAGLYYRTTQGREFEPRRLGYVGHVDSVTDRLEANPPRLVLEVAETLEGRAHHKRYTLTPVGRSLAVRLESLDGVTAAAEGTYMGATGGAIEGTTDGVNLRVPYMDAVPVTMLDHRTFVSTLLDPRSSHADTLVPRGPQLVPGGFLNDVVAVYTSDTAGGVAPVDETIWLTVSPRVDDTFPVDVGPASPNAHRLDQRALVELDGRPPAVDFAAEADYVASRVQLGMTDLIVVKEGWNDPTLHHPVQGPPDPDAGGEAGWSALEAAAPALAPALDWSEMDQGCPDWVNPLYDPAMRIVASDGTPKTWPDRIESCGTGKRSEHYLVPADEAAFLATGRAPPPPGADAAFVETYPTWNPGYAPEGADGGFTDRAAGSPHPMQLGPAFAAVDDLLGRLQRSTGPTLAPGPYGPWEIAAAALHEASLDGYTGELATGSPDGSGGSQYLVVPDYGLSRRGGPVRFGMGRYERFFDDPDGLLFPLSDTLLDEWRATSLAYGAAPAWRARPGAGPPYLAEAQEAAEYFLMKPMAERMLAAPSVAVGYVMGDGQEVDLGGALRSDADLAGPRLHLRFGGGLDVWVNHSADVWTLPDPYSAELPPTGWLFVDPAAAVRGFSGLVDGRRVDELVAPEWHAMDGRGVETTFGAATARDLKVVFPDGRTIEEAPDGSLSVHQP